MDNNNNNNNHINNQQLNNINSNNINIAPDNDVTISTQNNNPNKRKSISNNGNDQIKINKTSNNHPIFNANNVLIPGILCNCLSYLRIRELRSIINRVNKYWANHIYNNITVGYREICIDQEELELLCPYIDDNYNIDTKYIDNNEYNKVMNWFNQLKFAGKIDLIRIYEVEMLMHVILHAKYLKNLSIDFFTELDYLRLNDESLGNLRLDKLESLRIDCFDTFSRKAGDYHIEALAAKAIDYIMKQFIKHIDLKKITNIQLSGVPLKPQPLQIFETTTFANIRRLTILAIELKPVYSSLNYLSNLTELVELNLELNYSRYVGTTKGNSNWNWLSKLINLEIVYLYWQHSLPDQVQCVKALTSLPKLRELEIPLEILDSSNEYLQLFSPFKSLTSLSICTDSEKVILEGELKLIQFPTISSLEVIAFTQVGGFKGKFDSHIQSQHIIPIFASNPQIHTIAANITDSFTNMIGCVLSITAMEMMKILPYAPNLTAYDIERLDPVITCCAMMPTPLINHSGHLCVQNNLTRYEATFLSNTGRQELLNRLQLHVAPNYKCEYNCTSCKKDDK